MAGEAFLLMVPARRWKQKLNVGSKPAQKAELVKKASARGKHRKRRDRAGWAGMLLHQDGSTHE